MVYQANLLHHKRRYNLPESASRMDMSETTLSSEIFGTAVNKVKGPKGMFLRVTFRVVLSQKKESYHIEIASDVLMGIFFASVFRCPPDGHVTFEEYDLGYIAGCVWLVILLRPS